ncbi:MAG: glycoside hydrolase family 16 protein [Patescibacteria group bacterium]
MNSKNFKNLRKNLIILLITSILPATIYFYMNGAYESKASEVVYDQMQLKRKAYKETFANSLSQFDNFLGFDYTGKFKQIYNKENQYENNGSIFVSAQKKYTVNPKYDYKSTDPRLNTYSANYSGGQLILKEKFQYGHLQIKAKVPNVPGTLPAFWLINTDPNEGYSEIDLLEVPGTEKSNAYAAVHWGYSQSTLKNKWGVRKMPTIDSNYHWYDIYRFPDQVVILYDGVKVLEYDPRVSQLANGRIPLNDPMNLVINFNIGDKWSGVIDDNKLPAAIELKEVSIRHYR